MEFVRLLLSPRRLADLKPANIIVDSLVELFFNFVEFTLFQVRLGFAKNDIEFPLYPARCLHLHLALGAWVLHLRDATLHKGRGCVLDAFPFERAAALGRMNFAGGRFSWIIL